MGFFKEFKEDLAQAVNELLPDDKNDDNNDQIVNTLDSDNSVQDTEAESERMKELLEEIAQDGVSALEDEAAFLSGDESDESAEEIDEIKADRELSDIDELKTDSKEDGDTDMDDNIDLELLEALNADEEEKEEAKEEAKPDQNDKPVEKLRAASVNEEDVTVITKGTKINGSISTDGSLDIKGTVIGDIECLGKLSITGNVKGNTSASEVYINTERFEGSITSDGSVKIALGTVVIGDIVATSGVFAGAVKGEIDINGPVVIDSTAIIKGNIKAKSVQVNNGAVIEGFCSLTYSDVDLDNIFE